MIAYNKAVYNPFRALYHTYVQSVKVKSHNCM